MSDVLAPRVVVRNEHSISRKRIDPNALRVLYQLKRHGFTAYLVGGGVRDLLIGRKPKDFDIATDATPEQVRKLFRWCRLVGRRFRLAHVMFKGGFIEVATFRKTVVADTVQIGLRGDDTSSSRIVAHEGMIIRDNEYGTPAEDAVRRDFTVNALFYDLRDFSVIDYVGGLDDLRRGIIRSIGDPDVRFVEDPVRMLRAVRFSSVLGFEIDPASSDAMQRHHARLGLAHPSRLFDEWTKIIDSGACERLGPALIDSALLSVLFPAFHDWVNGDPGRRCRFVAACQRIDRERCRTGARVALEYALALLLGDYFVDRIEARTATGAAWNPSAVSVVDQTLKAGATALSIPRSIVQQTARLMAVQDRFRPGYRGRRQRFMQQTVFPSALAVFRFMCETGRNPTAWLEPWQGVDESASAGSENGAKSGTPDRFRSRRRRPGRRRRRRPNAPPTKVIS